MFQKYPDHTTYHTGKRKLRLPAALILSVVLLFSFSAVPVSAASAAGDSDPGILSAIKAFFTADRDTVVVTDVDYDRKDREVEFEFKGSVQWKSPKVKITRNGKNYVKRIKSKDSDELEVKLKSKLTTGKRYYYTITGVKNKNGTRYQTVTGSFKAIDD